MSMFDAIVGGAILVLILGCLFIGIVIGDGSNPVNNDDWKCTKSIVINQELPRREECVQYTKQAKGE